MVLAMDHLGKEDDAMNMTRALEALSPYLNDPRRTVVRIEAFVAAAAALLFLQLILGSCRRRTGHWFVQGTLWLAYTASFPLIAYTLGQMVSSPIQNALYPRWGVILFLAAGCTNSITAYNLEDNKQWKRYFFELLQYAVFIAVISQLTSPIHRSSYIDWVKLHSSDARPVQISFSCLCGVVTITNFVRAISGWMVTNPLPSNLVVDYMDWLVHERSTTQESFDPITMKGYEYLVCWHSRRTFTGNDWGTDGDGTISIDKIWEMEIDDSLLNTNGGGSLLKDVCLSFALSHLLKRRFFGLECAEAGLPETHNFVIEGLLSKEADVNSYSRAFHIIEVELGFLYDFFFTKYAALFHMEISYLVMVALKLTAICVGGVFLFRDSSVIETLDPVIEVGTRTVDVNITVIIMGIVFLVEALQAVLYLTSDWATVSLACSYTKNGTSKLVPSIIWFLRRFNLSGYWKRRLAHHKFGKFLLNSSRRMFGYVLDRLLFAYWKNKMGLSSVFEGCLHVNPYAMFRQMDFSIVDDLLCKALFHASAKIGWLIYSMVFSNTTFKVVPDLVKREIISCLQKSSVGGPLTNGEAALKRNGVDVKLPFALKTLEKSNQARIMIIWHVATEYCNVAHSNGAEGHQSSGFYAVPRILGKILCATGFSQVPKIRVQHSSAQEEEKVLKDNYRQVAITLSRYCAYLMSSVPDLLPGNSTDTVLRFHIVLRQASNVLGKRKPSRDVLVEAIKESEISSKEDTTITDSRGSNTHGKSTKISSSSDNNNTIIDISSGNIEEAISKDPSGNNAQDAITEDSSGNNTKDTGSITTKKKDTMFIKGLKLGKELEEIGDEVLLWKVLAEFWAETIIYIAPSDNVKAHMERLAQGGEFLTHVWALLTHAGILKRDQKQTHEKEA